jgi:hypothetical protein
VTGGVGVIVGPDDGVGKSCGALTIVMNLWFQGRLDLSVGCGLSLSSPPLLCYVGCVCVCVRIGIGHQAPLVFDHVRFLSGPFLKPTGTNTLFSPRQMFRRPRQCPGSMPFLSHASTNIEASL